MRRRFGWRDGACRGAAGLTLVELVVIVAVLAVLAGVSLPVASSVMRKVRTDSTKAEMADLAKAIRGYAADVGFDPQQVKWGRFLPEEKGQGNYKTILSLGLESDLKNRGWNPVLKKGWNGPYVTAATESTDADGDGTPESVRGYQVDSWGRYYLYRNRNDKGAVVTSKDTVRIVEIVSGGPDRDLKTAADNLEVQVFAGPIY
jgi:type II secretory pathway pseudopilin PulG